LLIARCSGMRSFGPVSAGSTAPARALLGRSFRAAPAVAVRETLGRPPQLWPVVLLLAVWLGCTWPEAGFAKTLVLRPAFRVATRGVAVGNATSLLTNGRYVFARRRAAAGEGRGVVIDDRTKAHWNVRYPRGCAPAAAGGPSLVFGCRPYANQQAQPPAKLYNFALRHWQSVPPSQPLVAQSEAAGCRSPQCTLSPVAVGRYWIEWSYDVPSCMVDHCEATIAFQNLTTGRLAYPQFDGSLVTNLDSRRLIQRLCPPLRTPELYPLVLGSAVFVGPFEVDPFDGYIQRCGSHRHYSFQYDLQPAINASVVLSRTYGKISGHGVYELSGRLLPSLRPIVLILPPRLNPPIEITAGVRHVYALTRWGQLLYASLPRGH